MHCPEAVRQIEKAFVGLSLKYCYRFYLGCPLRLGNVGGGKELVADYHHVSRHQYVGLDVMIAWL